MNTPSLFAALALTCLFLLAVDAKHGVAQSLDATQSILESPNESSQSSRARSDTAAPKAESVFEETLPSPVAEKPRRDSSASPEPDVRSVPPAIGAVPPLGLSQQPPTQQDTKRARLTIPRLPTSLGYDVVLAGPVHEALIPPDDDRSQRVIDVVAEAPPQPIAEREGADGLKFKGHNVKWLSGYWAWLDDTADYIWVSGMYRDCPPDRRWVAGYWSETTGGHRWTSGYWTDAQPTDAVAAGNAQVVYLPPPPVRPNVEPSRGMPASQADMFWVPAYWEYVDDQYSLKNGYWTSRVDNWIWQPAYYVNTPQGYVFVSGYWDYEPQFRGQAFACVDFDNRTLKNPSASYEPIYPLCSPAASILHLFVRADTGRYYYGDFYDSKFAEEGYQPWYQAAGEQVQQLPMLAYYDWKYGRYGFDFVGSMARYATHFRSAPSIRPAAQLRLDSRLALREGISGKVNATTFDQIVRGNVGGKPSLRLAASSLSRQPQVAATQPASAQAPQRQSQQNGRPMEPSNLPPGTAERAAGYRSPLGSSALPGLSVRPPTTLNLGGQPMLVFPGGRIGIGPPGILPYPPAAPVLRIPSPPIGPFGGFRLRGRR